VIPETGQVYSFGSNEFGQLGDGTIFGSTVPVAVNASGVLNGTIVKNIAVGNRHSLLLSGKFKNQFSHFLMEFPSITSISSTATGQVFSFGSNINGQLGDGTTVGSNVPVVVNGSFYDGHKIAAIAAGGFHSLLLSSKIFPFPQQCDVKCGFS